MQIGTVLDILSALQPYLLLPPREMEGVLPRSLDGGAGAGATATFLKACSRLDSMLDDSTRWSLSSHDYQSSLISEMYERQTEFFEAQIEASKEVQRPSFQLRPILAVGSGKFLAIWGNPERLGSALIGIGDTPDEALRDFDKAFSRRVEQQHQVEAQVEKPPAKPKKVIKPKKTP